MRTTCADRRARGARVRGFTLLEVLVALTIIAVALAASLRGAMALTGKAQDIDRRLLAGLSAENALLELRFARTQAPVGEIRFDCSQGLVVLACRQVVSATPNPFFRRVEVHVTGAGEDGSEYADLMSLLPVH